MGGPPPRGAWDGHRSLGIKMAGPKPFRSRAPLHDADRYAAPTLGRVRRRRAARQRRLVRLGPAAQGGCQARGKQSAARQTWTGHGSLEDGRHARGSFDIAGRKGYWIEEGRPADLFVFAWHPVIDLARVDHRDPRPWLFFVMPEPALPVRQKRLGLARIERRWPAVGFADLPAAVAGVTAAVAVVEVPCSWMAR
jgi:hypothetical protein